MELNNTISRHFAQALAPYGTVFQLSLEKIDDELKRTFLRVPSGPGSGSSSRRDIMGSGNKESMWFPANSRSEKPFSNRLCRVAAAQCRVHVLCALSNTTTACAAGFQLATPNSTKQSPPRNDSNTLSSCRTLQVPKIR